MRVTSLAEYVSAIETLIEQWTPAGVDWYLQPWFRGQRNAAWSLKPGWYRSSSSPQGVGDEYYSESQLLELFKLRAPTYLERLPASDWEWLFLMQHYGLPTRLLDWTESSLIGLYFAVREGSEDSDAAVWVLSPWWLNRATFGDYVLFSADDDRARAHAPLRPKQALAGKLPIALTPVRASQRIVSQRGVFTVHGSDPGGLDQLARQHGTATPCLRRIVLPRQVLGQVRRELSIAGITESLIFPELSGLCRELQTQFFGT